MKVNRRTVLTTAAIVGVVALAAGGTISYFTDQKTETNHFTVGDVKIELYESQLHRQNSGRQGVFPALASDATYCDWNYVRTAENGIDSNTGAGPQPNKGYESAKYCTPGINANEGNASTITAIANGHTKASRSWGYKDETIIEDASHYKDVAGEQGATEDGYFTKVSQNIVPGQYVRKFAYVQNQDQSSDAYILIRYIIPTEYDGLVELKVPGTPYEEDVSTEVGHQGYFTAIVKDNDGKYVAFDSSAEDSMDNYHGYTYTDPTNNKEYRVYAAVTTQAVEPGEMTFWSPINTVRLATTVDDEFNYGAAIDVQVDAQAIQAKTFSGAIDAVRALLAE